MQKWWKNPRIIGTAAYYAMTLLRISLRVRVTVDPRVEQNTIYLFAFWHGKQFLPSQLLHHVLFANKRSVMVSPSRDGAMLAVYLQKLGYEIIRGSSRDGGMRALLAMKNKLEQGYSIGFGIDGPIGPIHVVKPGMVYLAQKCAVKIIPVGSAFNSFWVFNKAWDKFQLPKPFTKTALVLGEPLTVVAGDDLKSAALELENRLKLSEDQAIALLK